MIQQIREIIEKKYPKDDVDDVMKDYIQLLDRFKLKTNKWDDVICLNDFGDDLDEPIFFVFKYDKYNVFQLNLMDVHIHKIKCHLLEPDKKCSLRPVRLMPNSSKNFYYALFAFEQGYELTVEQLEKLHCCKYTLLYSSEDNENENENLVIQWPTFSNFEIRDRKLVRGETIFTVIMNDECPCSIYEKDTNHFISGFSDEDMHFQLGDSHTEVYTNERGDLLIYHYGDVSSAIIIRHYTDRKEK